MNKDQLYPALFGLLAGTLLTSAAFLTYRRFVGRGAAFEEEELGTFVYSYPLDLEEEEEEPEEEERIDVTERTLIDEEMFPGFQE
jgi:hypothetical protein